MFTILLAIGWSFWNGLNKMRHHSYPAGVNHVNVYFFRNSEQELSKTDEIFMLNLG